ncbi:MAG: hypothetical protein HUU21_07485 [Polyangiaceae bacterium]|nr:hypothetical protein [Polyangiaceae bacterium]
MDRLFPKKNPEAAKKLLNTPDEKLTNIERDKKFILAMVMTPMPCPMCFAKVSVVEAADDTLEIGGDDYNSKYICPSCETELAKVVPFFLQPGTPGWHWQRKYPVAEQYYLVLVTGGTDICLEGPFETENARAERARGFWQREAKRGEDNVFCLYLGRNSKPAVGVFLEGDLNQVEQGEDQRVT